jgi:hypothetical protein
MRGYYSGQNTHHRMEMDPKSIRFAYCPPESTWIHVYALSPQKARQKAPELVGWALYHSRFAGSVLK